MDAGVGAELPLPGARAPIPRARVARDGSAGRIEPEWVHRQSRGRCGAGLLSPGGLGDDARRRTRGHAPILRLAPAALSPATGGEIGRASCRERVWVWGVAVVVKRKKECVHA